VHSSLLDRKSYRMVKVTLWTEIIICSTWMCSDYVWMCFTCRHPTFARCGEQCSNAWSAAVTPRSSFRLGSVSLTIGWRQQHAWRVSIFRWQLQRVFGTGKCSDVARFNDSTQLRCVARQQRFMWHDIIERSCPRSRTFGCLGWSEFSIFVFLGLFHVCCNVFDISSSGVFVT